MEHIIQFLYGEDGMAGEKLEGIKLPLLDMDNSKLRDQCYFYTDARGAQLSDGDKQKVLATISDVKEFMTPENAEDVLNTNISVSVALRLEPCLWPRQ